MTTVLVTNIAPGTADSTITEFFSFCGRIVNMTVENGDNQIIAHITFETPAAAKTSLLLSNALIADRPIQVQMDPTGASLSASGPTGTLPNTADSGMFSQNPQEEHFEEGAPLNEQGGNRAEPTTATSVIASLLAAGHKLSDTAVAEAKAFDDRFQVSTSVQSGLNDIKESLTEFGQKIGLVSATQNTHEYVAATAGQVSESADQSGVTDQATQAASSVENFFNNFTRSASAAIQSVASTGAQWAEENMPNAVATLRNAGQSIGATANTITSEAHRIYPGADALAQQQQVHEEPASAVDTSVPIEAAQE